MDIHLHITWWAILAVLGGIFLVAVILEVIYGFITVWLYTRGRK